MLLLDFDKEVEKRIQFWQKEWNCVIILSREEYGDKMDVFYPETGIIDRDIQLGKHTNKYSFLLAIGDYFRKAV